MGSLIDELQRREAAARAEAEELRGRIAELAERLARAEGRLSSGDRPGDGGRGAGQCRRRDGTGIAGSGAAGRDGAAGAGSFAGDRGGGGAAVAGWS
jgi:hypothetical protein